jgi:hypothetical protein
VNALARNDVLVQQSWLHNNYRGNLFADVSWVRLEQSVIERAGLRASDDRQVTPFIANGVDSFNLTGEPLRLESAATIVRNNLSAGIDVRGLGDVLPEDDAFCGNGGSGLVTAASPNGFIPSLNGQGGLGATYNSGNGARVAQDDFVAATLNNDSVFASNTECGLFNTWLFDPVQAHNNQWRGGPPENPVPDTCAGEPDAGPVDIGTMQDPDLTPIVITGTSPSNAILGGQTLRVLGSGFNAVRGNPLAAPGVCDAGVNTAGAGQGNSCCRKTTRANGCAGINQPIDGGGNCVELKNAQGHWTALGVKAVTPRLLETQVPSSVFSCIGSSNEMVRVSKKLSGQSPIVDTGPYCTMTNPL